MSIEYFSFRGLRPYCGLLGSFVLCGLAMAQTAKPLTLVVGMPAGGATDSLVRPLADELRVKIQRTVVIENRPGAGGVIAVERVKSAAVDGNTFLVAPTAQFSLYPLTMEKINYQKQDFVPIVHLATFEYGIAVASSLKVSNLPQYLQWLAKNPSMASLGVVGLAGPPQFYGKLFAHKFHLNMTPVPYAGTPPISNDLQGGILPAAILPLSELIRLSSSGNVKVLAVTGAKRSSYFKDAPTFGEIGITSAESGHYAIYAKKGTPQRAMDEVAAAASQILQTPEMTQKYQALYFEPTGFTGAKLRSAIQQNESVWESAVSNFR